MRAVSATPQSLPGGHAPVMRPQHPSLRSAPKVLDSCESAFGLQFAISLSEKLAALCLKAGRDGLYLQTLPGCEKKY